jgi:hypothetical protein
MDSFSVILFPNKKGFELNSLYKHYTFSSPINQMQFIILEKASDLFDGVPEPIVKLYSRLMLVVKV